MEKERGFKVLAVVALLVAVVGVSVGFAAFTKSFNVTANAVTVNAAADQFSSNLTLVPAENNGTVSGTVWTLPDTTLDETNNSVTYTATFTNKTSYVAYLTGITMPKLSDSACAYASGVNGDSDVLTAFCGNVQVSVQFGSQAALTATQNNAISTTYTSGSRPTVDKKGTNDGTTTVTVTVKTAANTVYPDAASTITIPQIQFDFSSIK